MRSKERVCSLTETAAPWSGHVRSKERVCSLIDIAASWDGHVRSKERVSHFFPATHDDDHDDLMMISDLATLCYERQFSPTHDVRNCNAH